MNEIVLDPEQVESFYVAVGRRLLTLRRQAHYNQEAMGAVLNVGQTTYSAMERGETRLTLAQVRLLRSHFRAVSYEWLIEGDESAA